jgi:hypothetical protein
MSEPVDLTIVTSGKKWGEVETLVDQLIVNLKMTVPPKLLVYVDEYLDVNPQAEKRFYRLLYTFSSYRESSWLPDFTARNQHRPVPSYRFNAIKFAHKVAAITAANEISSSRYLLWLDADVRVHQPIMEADVVSWLPAHDEWLSWLPRVGSLSYPETGFVLFNRAHPRSFALMLDWAQLYISDDLFDLAEWHDAFALESLVKRSGVKSLSLSGEGIDTAHPMINGPLGHWFDHLKGPKRKRVGKSFTTDLLRPRNEPYWK